jgi:RNA polymerase sigma factor (sigma-70 family)
MSTIEFNDSLISLEAKLISFAKSFTRSEEDARDLTQETMLKALVYKDYYKPQTNFKAWVFTIMRNVFINQYRRNSKSKTLFDYSKDLYLLANSVANYDTPNNYIYDKEINAQINALHDEYKKPFMMHHEGFKYKEISDKLDIPIGTVKSRIFIARKKLMEKLPEYESAI